MNEPQEWWEYCLLAQCTLTSPDSSLELIHKRFHAHPDRHRLRAEWIVDRAKRYGVDLDVDLVTEAAQRHHEDHVPSVSLGTIKITKTGGRWVR